MCSDVLWLTACYVVLCCPGCHMDRHGNTAHHSMQKPHGPARCLEETLKTKPCCQVQSRVEVFSRVWVSCLGMLFWLCVCMLHGELHCTHFSHHLHITTHATRVLQQQAGHVFACCVVLCCTCCHIQTITTWTRSTPQHAGPRWPCRVLGGGRV